MKSGRLAKLHGLGNDFLVLAGSQQRPSSEMARRLCDRHRGLGADGLLYLEPEGADIVSMVLLNSDGSRAEMSGNGIRCLAHAAFYFEMAASGEVAVDTDAGRRRVFDISGSIGAVLKSSVAMGRAEPLAPQQLPAEIASHDHLAFSVGNPHLVVRVSSLEDHHLHRWGPVLETAVSGGQNVHFVMPADSAHEASMRSWERGAGPTLACGTGVVAVANALQQWGIVDGSVVLHQPGGDAEVSLGADEAILTGPSEFVCEYATVAESLGGV